MSDDGLTLEFEEELFQAIEGYVAKRYAPLMDRVDELEAKLRALPVPKDGAPGQPGKDAPAVDVKALAAEVSETVTHDVLVRVDQAFKALPPAKDGEPGKDAPAPDVDAIVTAVLERVPKPKDGQPGERGEKGESIKGDRGEMGPPGASAFDLAVKEGFAGTVQQWLVSLKGKDGFGVQGEPGLRGKQGELGRDGRPGRDGKSADDPSVIATVADAVLPKLLAGIKFEVKDSGDHRHFMMLLTLLNGTVLEAPFFTPTQLNRGVWKQDQYELGDTVTRSGSQWYCRAEKTIECPGQSDDWILCVKKGTDGRDGDAVARSAPAPQPVVRLR